MQLVTCYNGLSSSLFMCEGLSNFGGGRGSDPYAHPLISGYDLGITAGLSGLGAL